jgi:peptide/nickel transport system substrate-binding protein
MRLRRLSSLIVLPIAAALIGFSAHAANLRIGVGADITSMDPHFVNLFPNNGVAEHIYDKLVGLDADSRLIPALAESWKTIDPTARSHRVVDERCWHLADSPSDQHLSN